VIPRRLALGWPVAEARGASSVCYCVSTSAKKSCKRREVSPGCYRDWWARRDTEKGAWTGKLGLCHGVAACLRVCDRAECLRRLLYVHRLTGPQQLGRLPLFRHHASPPRCSLQVGNDRPGLLLEHAQSAELQDNHIGCTSTTSTDTAIPTTSARTASRVYGSFPDGVLVDNGLDPATLTLESIPASVDDTLIYYASHGVKVVLSLWMGAGFARMDHLPIAGEVDRFVEYVRLSCRTSVVDPYYEIWNEPAT